MSRICVVGGSSPFTVALIDALEAEPSLRLGLMELELTLQGRNVIVLDAVSTYGRRRLERFGASVVGTTQLDSALAGAEIVIVQTRFGGLEARLDDEHFAEEIGCGADETLGPCGLLSAFRQFRQVDDLAARIRAICPDAFVMNMINPLSLTTKMMESRGVNTVGICELPLETLSVLAQALGRDPTELTWSYEGFNHRGFITAVIARDGEDVLRSLARARPNAATQVCRDDVCVLGAIPTKYFSFFRGEEIGGRGRAATLMELRGALAREVVADPSRRPDRIADRRTPWYAQAVAPLLAARLGFKTYDATLNVASDDGLVWERRARILRDRVELLPQTHVDGPFRTWLAMFEQHERLCLMALTNPTPYSIGCALAADCTTPPDKLDIAIARIIRIWDESGAGVMSPVVATMEAQL